MISPPPTFFDLEVVLAGLELHRRGEDPYVSRLEPGAAYVFNYPASWLALAPTGWSVTDAVPIACAILIGFFAVVVWILPADRWAIVAWLPGALLSPPILSAVGTLNTDLVIFILLVAAAVWHATSPRPIWGPTAIMACAAVLKLFPVIALPALLDGARRTLIPVAAALVALGAWFIGISPEIRAISENTPRSHVRAYGAHVMGSRLLAGAPRHPGAEKWLDKLGAPATRARNVQVLASGAFVFGTLGAFLLGARRKVRDPVAADSWTEVLFRCGAWIYLGTFALGHNWVHREIFLLFVVPASFLAPVRTAGRRALPWLVLALFWLTSVPGYTAFVLGQFLSWLVVGCCAFSLGQIYGAHGIRLWPPRARRPGGDIACPYVHSSAS